MPVFNAFISYVDSTEEDGDRLWVRYATQPGRFFVRARKQELVAELKRSKQTGALVEVTFNPHTTEIADVVRR